MKANTVLTQTLTLALPALRVDAEAGVVEAQYRLGVLYDDGDGDGDGVVADVAEALKWYRRAAERGHPRAQWRLGYAYREGEGVEQNDSEAVRWYRTAAQAGDPGAQYDLARMCEDGRGTRENASEALRLFRAAAEQGDAEGPVQPRRQVSTRLGWSLSGRARGGPQVPTFCGAGRRRRSL